MKKSVLILTILIYCLTAVAQTSSQKIVAGRKNNAVHIKKPYIVIISADGFRSDYATKYQAKNLLQLAAEGVEAAYMIPSFPSVTRPNHFAMMSGLYPAHSGIVANGFYDANRKEKWVDNDATFIKTEPIWITAEKNNLLTASMLWPNAIIPIQGVLPTYNYDKPKKGEPTLSSDDRVNALKNWLQMPEETRPHFISIYLGQADHAGHEHGPESAEVIEAVRSVDHTVGELAAVAKASGLPVNFIFVSDHGMKDVDLENPIEIPELLQDKNRFIYVNAQTLFRVTVKDESEVQQVYRELKKNKTEGYKVYLTENFPKNLHYSTADDRFDRIGQILLVPDAPKVFLEPNSKKTPGKHGYNPYKVPEMKSTFVASGPAFKKGKKIGQFRNVNIYPMIAEILGLKITEPIDGKNCTAKKVLK